MHKKFVLIDSTQESHAPFFAQNPIFQSWLRSFNNISHALDFINQTTLPYSIEVYLARDDLLQVDTRSDTNDQRRTLIQILPDLNQINHISVYSPDVSPDLEPLILASLTDKRLLKKVLSVINLHSYMCLEGMSHINDEISHCIATRQLHLSPNFRQNRDQLMEYLETIIADRNAILADFEDNHSNRPSEQQS